MSEINNETINKKRGLGRGLGSLLGGAHHVPVQDEVSAQNIVSEAAQPGTITPTKSMPATTTQQNSQSVMSEGKVWQVGIDKIKPGTYQPRQEFQKETLQELAQSIQQNGILQPLTVRRNEKGQFELIAGERRWRAAQLAGLHEVPVLIRQFGNQQTLELSLIENIQREDLSPLDEAEAYSRLATEFHLSQQQIAEKVGKDRATVANSIRLLSLPKNAKDLLSQGLISVGHAKVLLGVQDSKQLEDLAKKVAKEKIAVRQLEKLVLQANQKDKAQSQENLDSKADSPMMSQLVVALSEELQKMLGTKVLIDYRDGKGQVKISFYSNEELNGLIEKLKVSPKR